MNPKEITEGEIVQMGAVIYTFRNVVARQGEVAIGANDKETFENLRAAHLAATGQELPIKLADNRMCLSVRQPWAWLLTQGPKRFENRSRRFSFRGTLWIHAGLVFEYAAYGAIRREFPGIKMPDIKDYQIGGIVGKVRVVDCVSHSTDPWFCGPHALVCEERTAVPFEPLLGRQGLFYAGSAKKPRR